jgi:hypothetical protein
MRMKNMFLLVMVVAGVLLSQGVFAVELNYNEQRIADAGEQEPSVSIVYIEGVEPAPPGSGDDQQQTGIISGTVYGKRGWSVFPLMGATVAAGGRQTYTGISGSYRIGNLPLGTYIVVASYPGYGSKSATVTLTNENPQASVHFILEKSSGGGNNAFSDNCLHDFLSQEKLTPIIEGSTPN